MRRLFLAAAIALPASASSAQDIHIDSPLAPLADTFANTFVSPVTNTIGPSVAKTLILPETECHALMATSEFAFMERDQYIHKFNHCVENRSHSREKSLHVMQQALDRIIIEGNNLAIHLQ